MINAKQELLQAIDGTEITCAIMDDFSSKRVLSKSIQLKQGHTQKELDDFLNELDFEYDETNPFISLKGYIWLNDGGWLERKPLPLAGKPHLKVWMRHLRMEIPEPLRHD